MNDLSGLNVLVTGHTGFKGSWLCHLLDLGGAKVSGLSLDPDTPESLFEVSEVSRILKQDIRGDIREFETCKNAINRVQPDVLIHLAAQPLVLRSYEDPLATFDTNIMGTANLLQAVIESGSPSVVVIATTDKVYGHGSSAKGFAENDRLFASDPYGTSKVCVELIAETYRESVRVDRGAPVRIATARAGNVIGGGDWSANRLVPDFVNAWREKIPMTVRHPQAVRPWQHVLEPVGGYVTYAAQLRESSDDEVPSSVNFGPNSASHLSVGELLNMLNGCNPEQEQVEIRCLPSSTPESQALRLNSSLANARLSWSPTISVWRAIQDTMDWYRAFSAGEGMYEFTRKQIQNFQEVNQVKT
jgi:CDP-glucose 4,6-dehydratase